MCCSPSNVAGRPRATSGGWPTPGAACCYHQTAGEPIAPPRKLPLMCMRYRLLPVDVVSRPIRLITDP